MPSTSSGHVLVERRHELELTDHSTWVECYTGMTAMPTFTVPECAATPSSSFEPAKNGSSPTLANDVASITPAPSVSMPRAGNSTDCQPLVICIMAVASCGGTGKKYGT